MSASRIYSFGEYTLDLARGALLRAGADVKLRPKSFAVLRLLVERHGQLVTKDELLDAVWGRTVVTEGSVVQCLIDARRAIGDESQQMIKTVPRRGYIFDLPVTVSDSPPQEPLVAGSREMPLGDADPWSSSAPADRGRALTLRSRLLVAVFVSLVPIIVWWALASRGTDAVPPGARTTPSQAPRMSVAVLPFLNMSSDPDSDYFCDGISEEILNRLAGFPELQVIARTSSFALKDSGLDARKLSDLLGVRYLLQGSVRKDGTRLRITAQLVDSTAVQVWSDAYERDLRDVFAIQKEIAEAVATSVVPKIVARSPTEPEVLPNLDAYQHYLAGRRIFDERQPRYAELAQEQFERAVAIDAAYAEPLAELAILWAAHSGTAPQAELAISRALSLKPDLARAYAARGRLLAERHPPDYVGSEAAFRRALTIDPNMVDASNWLATILGVQGRHAERFTILQGAANIDPLAAPLMTNLASAYAEQGDFSRAEQIHLRLLELPNPSYYVYWSLFEHYLFTGQLVESNVTANRLVSGYEETGPLGAYGYLAWSYARLGLWSEAEYWLKRLAHEGPAGPDPSNRDRLELMRFQGRSSELAELWQATLESTGTKLPRTPEYGILRALVGDYRGAISTLAPILNVDEPAHNEIDADARHALAWAYLNSGAPESARRILSAVERGYRERQKQGWLHLSVDLAMFAQNAVLSGDNDLAIERLGQAVKAGWRNYYSVSNDPRWKAVGDDPRFKRLLATVKADVDAQRARVEQRRTLELP